jgi:histidinol-phosphate aminotransferase
MATPRARRALDDIPVYRPGKPAESDELKLSSNENPYPPLPGVIERTAEALARVNRYPDAGSTDLYAALSRTYDLPSERFAVGTGSVAVLFALLTAFCEEGDEIVYAWRSFEAYPIAADLTGATTVRVPLRPDATHDLEAMAAAVTERTRAILVCSPNNPTGPVATQIELERLVATVPDDVIIVVDEAYVEFVRQEDAASGLALADHENVVVLRTFSKAYGLAGLRVGYAIAAPPVAESIRKAVPPFSVTDVAQAAAVASLDAADELFERVDAIVGERERVLAALRDQGWDVPDSQANFVWLPLGNDALDFAVACDPISVRPFAGDGVRVSIGDPDVNNRFLEVASRWTR